MVLMGSATDAVRRSLSALYVAVNGGLRWMIGVDVDYCLEICLQHTGGMSSHEHCAATVRAWASVTGLSSYPATLDRSRRRHYD